MIAPTRSIEFDLALIELGRPCRLVELLVMIGGPALRPHAAPAGGCRCRSMGIPHRRGALDVEIEHHLLFRSVAREAGAEFLVRGKQRHAVEGHPPALEG